MKRRSRRFRKGKHNTPVMDWLVNISFMAKLGDTVCVRHRPVLPEHHGLEPYDPITDRGCLKIN